MSRSRDAVRHRLLEIASALATVDLDAVDIALECRLDFVRESDRQALGRVEAHFPPCPHETISTAYRQRAFWQDGFFVGGAVGVRVSESESDVAAGIERIAAAREAPPDMSHRDDLVFYQGAALHIRASLPANLLIVSPAGPDAHEQLWTWADGLPQAQSARRANVRWTVLDSRFADIKLRFASSELQAALAIVRRWLDMSRDSLTAHEQAAFAAALGRLARDGLAPIRPFEGP